MPKMFDKECSVCGSKIELSEISGIDSQFDGFYICDECLNENENRID